MTDQPGDAPADAVAASAAGMDHGRWARPPQTGMAGIENIYGRRGAMPASSALSDLPSGQGEYSDEYILDFVQTLRDWEQDIVLKLDDQVVGRITIRLFDDDRADCHSSP